MYLPSLFILRANEVHFGLFVEIWGHVGGEHGKGTSCGRPDH